MYTQLFLKNSPFVNDSQLNFQLCIIAGNWLLITCGLITAALITMNFALDQYVSLSTQIAGHVGTILSASLFKIGYVIRCVGVHGLGYKVF
ncbi:hypothetical protein GCM10017161_19270 [Thalassotalea marina]|uniref:Uncharacterized protein n=1 Tax=Thalassotalea marina TaxID=1673741 RepID=A0A919BJE8_9GAMM|nr:hypothetical protein GCM10017161_19270 [Thalassotalea marina]